MKTLAEIDLQCAIGMVLMGLALASPAGAQFYRQTNLVSDIPGTATITDPNLVNRWGVSHTAASPFWVSDAGKSVSTVYSVNPTTGTVTKSALTVTVPGFPTGQVVNTNPDDFIVLGGGAAGPSTFIFAGLGGFVSGWNPNIPPPSPSTRAHPESDGGPGAVYTGITSGTRDGVQFLYAANPTKHRIDVYGRTWALAQLHGNFTDPSLPPGDAPFNISNIGGRLFVAYVGAVGVVNVFDTDGNFLQRFATGGPLNNPWGMAIAPAEFGKFSNALLVGNFNEGNPANGPGLINAFNLSTGLFWERCWEPIAIRY
jgi:uncharacterized protein (TIGR03118 family)